MWAFVWASCGLHVGSCAGSCAGSAAARARLVNGGGVCAFRTRDGGVPVALVVLPEPRGAVLRGVVLRVAVPCVLYWAVLHSTAVFDPLVFARFVFAWFVFAWFVFTRFVFAPPARLVVVIVDFHGHTIPVAYYAPVRGTASGAVLPGANCVMLPSARTSTAWRLA